MPVVQLGPQVHLVTHRRCRRIARDPDARLREISTDVGITERSVQTILNDLVADGYVERSRVGRRNHYAVNGREPPRRRVRADVDFDVLLRLIL